MWSIEFIEASISSQCRIERHWYPGPWIKGPVAKDQKSNVLRHCKHIQVEPCQCVEHQSWSHEHQFLHWEHNVLPCYHYHSCNSKRDFVKATLKEEGLTFRQSWRNPVPPSTFCCLIWRQCCSRRPSNSFLVHGPRKFSAALNSDTLLCSSYFLCCPYLD